MNGSLREKLLKDIQKTGYPVELGVGDIFSRQGWGVQYSRYYVDRDEQKGKEIDISAYRVASAEKVRVGLHLICEVKKSLDRPWIIFSTGREVLDSLGWNRLHYSFRVDHKVLSYNEMEKGSSDSGFLRIGRSYHEAFKSQDEKSRIFKALTSSVKASEDCLERNRDASEKSSKDTREQIEFDRVINFVEPVVILDGLLYEAYLNDRAELELNEIGHIPVSFGYISSGYVHYTYLVDVVTVRELANLVSSKEKWIAGIRDTIQKKKGTSKKD